MSQERKARHSWRFLRDLFRRIFRRKREPEDPYAYHMASIRHGPKGRGGAAVAEPEEEYRWSSFPARHR